jgi:hypothetical protein
MLIRRQEYLRLLSAALANNPVCALIGPRQ